MINWDNKKDPPLLLELTDFLQRVTLDQKNQNDMLWGYFAGTGEQRTE